MRIASTSCCFMAQPASSRSSHERPTVARLMASARRPSSASSAAIGPPSVAACSCTRALISVKIARNTAACRLGPTATKPCARSSRTALSPSASASAAPRSALLMTMSVVPNRGADVEHRHAGREERGVVIRRAHRRSDEAERDDRRRMPVRDGHHVRPPAVDRRRGDSAR